MHILEHIKCILYDQSYGSFLTTAASTEPRIRALRGKLGRCVVGGGTGGTAADARSCGRFLGSRGGGFRRRHGGSWDGGSLGGAGVAVGSGGGGSLGGAGAAGVIGEGGLLMRSRIGGGVAGGRGPTHGGGCSGALGCDVRKGGMTFGAAAADCSLMMGVTLPPDQA